jgi:Electron transfer DM13
MLSRFGSVLLVVLSAASCNNATPPTAPDAVPLAPDAGAPPVSGVTAVFKPTGHAVSGSATLGVSNGAARLSFSPDFSTDRVPGPVVYLNTTNNPNSGKPLRVGALKSLKGAQDYTFSVPAGTSYTYVLIWCDPFNVPMAEAMIPPTP